MADLASRTMRSNSGSSAGLASEHSGGDSRGELEDDFDADLAVGGEVDLDGECFVLWRHVTDPIMTQES